MSFLISFAVRSGLVNFSFKDSLFTLFSIPAELETLTTRAWGRNNGKKASDIHWCSLLDHIFKTGSFRAHYRGGVWFSLVLQISGSGSGLEHVFIFNVDFKDCFDGSTSFLWMLYTKSDECPSTWETVKLAWNYLYCACCYND